MKQNLSIGFWIYYIFFSEAISETYRHSANSSSWKCVLVSCGLDFARNFMYIIFIKKLNLLAVHGVNFNSLLFHSQKKEFLNQLLEVTTILQKQPSIGFFLRKVVLKICRKFTGEHPFPSVISIKLQSTLRHGCSPVNLLHVFRTPLDDGFWSFCTVFRVIVCLTWICLFVQ